MQPIYIYLTLAKDSEGSYHDSGSKFHAYAYPASSRTDLEQHLEALRVAHPKARHQCYAYRILEREEITEYASDAGEPSGSAGQPILGELIRRELVNVCVVVVRYFGGTKLGIPGLIHAYRESTSHCIGNGEIIAVERKSRYQLKMPMALQPLFYDTCKHLKIEIVDTVYDAHFSAEIRVPLEHAAALLTQAFSRMAGTEGALDYLTKRLGIELSEMDQTRLS